MKDPPMNQSDYPKRLIEVDLPIARISTHAHLMGEAAIGVVPGGDLRGIVVRSGGLGRVGRAGRHGRRTVAEPLLENATIMGVPLGPLGLPERGLTRFANRLRAWYSSPKTCSSF